MRYAACFTKPSFFFIAALVCSNFSPLLAQKGQLSGKVTDAESGEPLPGANIVVRPASGDGVQTGDASDVDGNFTVRGLDAGTYFVSASFIGYQKKEFASVSIGAGEQKTLDIALTPSAIRVNAISVSASRRPQKTLEAPAAITVLEAADIRAEIAPSAVSVLKNTPGLDMSNTGIDRREVVLRGFNNAFSGATYILTDYRQAAVPSLGVNVHSIMPNLTIDLDRVEVVRGPGSALYGAGVDAGVIHYITRGPFADQSTTLSFSGGERNFLTGALRHSGLLSDKVGYKVTAQYGQADDWELDPADSLDRVQLNLDLEGLERQYDFQKLNINGLLEFKPSNGMSLIFNGGFSELDATVLSGIGTVQAVGFGYRYGQARLQSGRFFSQLYLNKNNAGDSFIYGTGDPVVDHSLEINGQAQYDFDLGASSNLILGFDYNRVDADTRGTIYGRNEIDAVINEYGFYGQTLTQLSPKLDLTLAVRGDYNNVFEKLQFSPRVALVYKANAKNSFRATFNRAFSSPSNNSLFLDIVAAQVDIIKIRGRGSWEGFSYARNPEYTSIAGSDLIARSLDPTTLGEETPVGIDLEGIYAQLFNALEAVSIDSLRALLPAPLNQAGDNTLLLLRGLLNPLLTDVSGFSQGELGLFNPISEQIQPISDVGPIPPLGQSNSMTWEVGYKGLLGDKLMLAVDAYYTIKENFSGPLLNETPFVLVPNLGSDLGSALAEGIANNTVLANAIGNLDLTSEQVAQLIVQVAENFLPDGETPVALVVPVENDLGAGDAPELLFSYRNFGRIKYWGLDASMQFYVNDRVRVFANASYISDDFFDHTELGEDNPDLSLSLNAPTVKVKGGFSYNARNGFTFGASGRYVNEFYVSSGPYNGDVPAFFLLDLNFGYDLSKSFNGLRFDLSVQNALNNEHREFIGAPKLGRLVMARTTLTF